MITIENAKKEQASAIARMIMEAMNHECCQWFAGPNHTLDDFHRLITGLVETEHSQYSFLNTLVAVDKTGRLIGICVTYDGALLHELRRAFVDGAKEAFGRDFSDMPDETTAGELYIDSLCVDKAFRGRGIATLLLEAAVKKGKDMGLPTGLLVDKGNPRAERLYIRAGFRYDGDNLWGGHAMRHLVHPQSSE